MLNHHDIVLRGSRIHYVEAGAGPTLLLIHGFLVSHKEWLDVLPALAERYRCIVPDLPGFGASEKLPPSQYPYTREAFAGTMADLLSALGIRRAHVCGHSMGGSIALAFASDYPELVERLVVLDSACYPFELSVKAKLPLVPVLGSIVFKQLYGRSLFHDYFKNDVWSGHAGIDMARVDAYYDDFNHPEAKDAAYAAMLSTVDLASLGPKIARVRAPTRVIWGSDDRIFALRLGQRLAREIAGAELSVLEGVAHAPNEERPAETAALIVEHLSRSA